MGAGTIMVREPISMTFSRSAAAESYSGHRLVGAYAGRTESGVASEAVVYQLRLAVQRPQSLSSRRRGCRRQGASGTGRFSLALRASSADGWTRSSVRLAWRYMPARLSASSRVPGKQPRVATHLRWRGALARLRHLKRATMAVRRDRWKRHTNAAAGVLGRLAIFHVLHPRLPQTARSRTLAYYHWWYFVCLPPEQWICSTSVKNAKSTGAKPCESVAWPMFQFCIRQREAETTVLQMGFRFLYPSDPSILFLIADLQLPTRLVA
jgi:hypothetical protein